MYAGADLAVAGIPCLYADLADECRKYAWASSASRLRRVARIRRPDILHSTLFRSDQVTRVVGAQLGIPVVGSLVSDSYGSARTERMTPSQRRRLLAVQALDRVTAPLVDVFIANSDAAAEAGMRDLGIAARRIVVVPRGRDLSRFRLASSRESLDARRSLAIAESERVIVTVGRLIRSKNHALMIEALATTGSADRLVIVGDGPVRARLEAFCEAAGVAGRVTFLGARNDVDVILRAADAFVFASAFEGSPGVVIEALATGLPCVLVDLPVVRELASSDSARFFAPGSVAACAAALTETLAQSPTARAAMIASARRDAERFSIEAMVDRHEHVYSSVLGHSM